MMLKTKGVQFLQNEYGYYYKETWGDFGSNTESRKFKTMEECMKAYEKYKNMEVK